MSCSVHDVIDLETRGVPGVLMASSEFVDAADAQSRALGATPRVVFVPHPIQDRTDEEIRALAGKAVDEILAALRPAGREGAG